jgi:molecular chaperone HscB
VASPSPSEPAVDHFTRLGLTRAWSVDRDALEAAYLERAAKAHPDRFVGAPSADRRAAMELSAAINEGYRVLRDPVRRAEYLCLLAGVDLDSSDPRGGAPHMGQEFLIEMIERRETVADARAAGAAARDELRAAVEGEADDALDEAVAALDAGGIESAARCLVKRRYLQRLLDEIDADAAD